MFVASGKLRFSCEFASLSPHLRQGGSRIFARSLALGFCTKFICELDKNPTLVLPCKGAPHCEAMCSVLYLTLKLRTSVSNLSVKYGRSERVK